MIDDDDDDFDANHSMDLISSCKEFYIKRVRCLDDFRDKFAYSSPQFTYLPKCPEMKASSDVSTSKCSIISPQMKLNGDVSTSNRNNNSTLSDGLIQLKADMMSLMENDILLTGKLIALSESIGDFKRQRCANRNCNLSSSSSLISLNGEEDLGAKSYHNINRVTIEDFEDEDEDEILETVEIPRRDYFARQSSVLRIPIPPSRHRSRSYVETMDDAAISECSSDKSLPDHTIFKRQSLPNFGANHHSSSSSSTSSSHSVLHSPASDSGVSVDLTPSIVNHEDDNSTMTTTTKLSCRSHDSQNSFDSGIHLVSPMEDKICVNV